MRALALLTLAACSATQPPAQTQQTPTPTADPPPSFTTPPVPPPALTSTAACATDADCVIADQRQCCSSCPENAYATSVKEVDAERRRCTTMDCTKVAHPQCAEFVSAREYRAVCRTGTCAGIKR